ncbi:Flp pilus assembly protein TadG [Variovorax boronicumulans]|uniref:TadE/TadG family type IV pilus assembly protein n=1 Tax=Variovorax boronicumulans TaxID=436515 RepID=UPI002781082C|nr:TadE/TadG family type IV pilus assembly protein [Variovorax boronicumulans]MDP9990586.1 Flp pilus assembly protein TadG [Variovorax boronicumulans]MDQ0000903.1 Flp pilus assembly protein TadG [Variovorax boronicumulans]
MSRIQRKVCNLHAPRWQKGLAATEFALVFTALFFAIYGIASLGSVLYVQQVVSRAAEDGARAALLLSQDISNNDARVQSAIYQSLASSSITPSAAGSTIASKFDWLKTNMAGNPPTVNITSPLQIAVKVSYPYGENPIVPPLPFTGILTPATLQGKATGAKSLP